MLRCLEKTGEQGDKDYSNLLEKLKQLQTNETAAVEKSSVGEVWGLFEEVEPETAPASPVLPAGPAPAGGRMYRHLHRRSQCVGRTFQGFSGWVSFAALDRAAHAAAVYRHARRTPQQARFREIS